MSNNQELIHHVAGLCQYQQITDSIYNHRREKDTSKADPCHGRVI